MRKIFIISCLLSFFFFTYLLSNKDEDTITVFDGNSEEYNIFLLNLEKDNITTNNITTIFDNIKILEIYPYINPIYKSLIKKSFTFNTRLSNKKNISNFINIYSNQLNKNALILDNIMIKLNGIKIEQVKIYTSNKILDYLIKNYKIKIIN